MHRRHSREAGVHAFDPTAYGSPLREDDEIVVSFSQCPSPRSRGKSPIGKAHEICWKRLVSLNCLTKPCPALLSGRQRLSANLLFLNSVICIKGAAWIEQYLKTLITAWGVQNHN